MRLEQSFEVPVSVATAWEVLLDLEKIAPCMPGATLTGFNGTDFTGLVKVKLGPVSLSYKGNGRFVERDEAGRRVAFIASGQDSRGAGGASARVTAVLHENNGGASTVVKVVADLDIAGKAAQFGRGMIADVSGKLVRQFAECLATTIADAPPAAAPPVAVAAAVAPAPVTPLPPVTMPPPSPDLAPPPAPAPATVAAPAPAPVAAPPIAPPSEYHPLAMQEPPAQTERPSTPAGPAAEPPAPAPAPQVEALPEVKAASEYAYDPAPPVAPSPSPAAQPSGSGAGVSSSGEAPMTLSRPPVEGAPIDLIAVSGAKRRLLVPGLVLIAVVVIVVVLILALG
jgi:carbon monoxide dehydrogenase subunit G